MAQHVGERRRNGEPATRGRWQGWNLRQEEEAGREVAQGGNTGRRHKEAAQRSEKTKLAKERCRRDEARKGANESTWVGKCAQ